MARRKKGEVVNGWVILDKPLGLGSTQAVSAVRRITNAQKIGHGGTLDPLASGILPIGLGEATKAMPYIVDASKDYDFTIRWGAETSTDDLEGEVTASNDVRPTEAEIAAILADFTGSITQVPPAYSAIKIDGERAYARVRAGEEVEMPARTVEIHALGLVSHDAAKGETMLSVTCGKGTYVRALGRDIARALGGHGHLSALRRTRVGPFSLESAISLEKLTELGHSAPASDYVLSVMTALDDIPALAVSEAEADRIRCGQQIRVSGHLSGLHVLTYGGTPLALATAAQGLMVLERVFNL